MIRRTMPHQGVLSTNRVDRRRPRLRKIHSSLLEKILAIMQRVLMQARRAKALRASVSRRPCTTKKETPGEAPGVGVRLSQASTHCRGEYNARTYRFVSGHVPSPCF